jgi:hypothetical protein
MTVPFACLTLALDRWRAILGPSDASQWQRSTNLL